MVSLWNKGKPISQYPNWEKMRRPKLFSNWEMYQTTFARTWGFRASTSAFFLAAFVCLMLQAKWRRSTSGPVRLPPDLNRYVVLDPTWRNANIMDTNISLTCPNSTYKIPQKQISLAASFPEMRTPPGRRVVQPLISCPRRTREMCLSFWSTQLAGKTKDPPSRKKWYGTRRKKRSGAKRRTSHCTGLCGVEKSCGVYFKIRLFVQRGLYN